VPTEPVHRIFAIEFDQHRIAVGLGEDRCRRNRRNIAIAADDRPRWTIERRTMLPVDPRDVRMLSK
jgi:hypothetical protein